MSYRKVEETAYRGHSANFRTAINLPARQIQETKHFFREWENGPFCHLTGLSIPPPSARHGFKFAAHGQLFEGLLAVKVYCDSLVGVSGSNREQDPVVADLVTAGKITFRGGRETYTVTPGRICIRDTKASWEFSCAPATRLRVVRIPRHVVLSHAASPKTLRPVSMSDITAPEVRFLMNFLEAIERSSDDLGGSALAQKMALDAGAVLFSRMLSGRSGAEMWDHQNAVLVAAKNAIERNLDRHDLSPTLVAQMVGVSPRTLHRSFSESDESLMAFVRRRRLEKAHSELVKLGRQSSVSEIAARWHFADASHFIRNFRSLYGTTPAAYLRSLGGRQQMEP